MLKIVTGAAGVVFAALAALWLFCWLIVALVDLTIAHSYWARHEFGYRPNDGNNPHYLFYSGFGSILLPPFITLLGIGAGFWWHNQCSMGGCYWYARRKTDAGDRACFLHHPRKQLTVEEIHERHRLHLGHQPGRG